MSKTHNTENDSGDFTLRLSPDGTWRDEAVQIALLADIRRELRKLNRLLTCPNFTGMPHTLATLTRRADSIDRRLQAHMPLRKNKKVKRATRSPQ